MHLSGHPAQVGARTLCSGAQAANRHAAWGAYEIGGVALLGMHVWRWMYAHPDATPVQFRDAVLGIAKDTWNKMIQATGKPVGSEALMAAATRALREF